MSGAPSVPAAILAVYVENTTAKIVLGITAVICFVLSGFLVWRIERQKVVDLERKLTPSITVRYDPRIPQCKATPLFEGGRRAVCFRLEIENLGAEIINDCTGTLVEVRRKGDQQELGAMPLTWAGTEIAEVSVSLINGIKRHLDVVRVWQDNAVNVATPKNVWPLDRQDMFGKPGDYIFTVVVSGDGSVPVRYSMELTHTDNWETADIHNVKKSSP
jgi:hypothetical protein